MICTECCRVCMLLDHRTTTNLECKPCVVHGHGFVRILEWFWRCCFGDVCMCVCASVGRSEVPVPVRAVSGVALLRARTTTPPHIYFVSSEVSDHLLSFNRSSPASALRLWLFREPRRKGDGLPPSPPPPAAAQYKASSAIMVAPYSSPESRFGCWRWWVEYEDGYE